MKAIANRMRPRTGRIQPAGNYNAFLRRVMASDTKTESPRRNATMIALAAVGILGGLLAVFATISGFNPFAQMITVTTYFSNSEGLKSGAAVNLNGVTVGTVKRVDLITGPEHRKASVLVTMKLNTKFLSGLHTDSLASLTSLGALADTVVDIDSQHATGPPLQDGAELPTLNSPTVLNFNTTQDTMNDVHALMGRLDTLVDQVQTGKGSIGQLMSNPGLTKEATATITRVKQVSAKLNSTHNTAGKILNDHSITDKLADISTHIEQVQASVGKLTNGPLNANLTTAQSQANQLTADFNAGHGAAGMLINNPAFKKQMSDTTANAKGVIADIDKGQGSAGKLLHDGGLQVHLTKLQADSSALATMIRQNPKKYLTIEIRLF
jgi:phospholipid/cholesterol/gamma-HCH transport system substrate-binding protein